MSNVHNSANYLAIVRHFINIGHIHTFSTFDKIIAEGSFDRLAHGEEEAKGGVICRIRRSGQQQGNNSFEFIENKHAKIYKTVLLRSKDLERSIKQIDRSVTGLPTDSHIRIKATKDHPAYIAFDEIKKKYPQFNFTKISIEEDTEQHEAIKELTDTDNYVAITITRDNISDTLLQELNKYQLPHETLSLAQQLIEAAR